MLAGLAILALPTFAGAHDVIVADDFNRAALGSEWAVEGRFVALDPTSGRGGSGSALRIDGRFARSYERVSRVVTPGCQSNRSVKKGEIWVRIDSLVAMRESWAEIELLRLTDGTGGASVWARPEIAYVAIDVNKRLFLRAGKGTYLKLDIGPWDQYLPAGAWHRIAVTYDPSAPRVEVEIDGVLVKTMDNATILGLLDGRIGGIGYIGMGGSTANLVFDDLLVFDEGGAGSSEAITLPATYEFSTAPDDTDGDAWVSLRAQVAAAAGLLTYTWSEGGISLASGAVVVANGVAEVPFDGWFDVGVHEIDLAVGLPGGCHGSASTEVIVRDATPPRLWVGVDPGVLWPPNHKLVEITPTFLATDNVDDHVTVRIVSATSSEPDDAPGAGDGHTTEDTRIDADGHLWLRAERDGSGPGRIYTFLYRATDAAGNSSETTVETAVPHSMR